MAKLLAVSGSLRAGSYNTALAQALIKQAPAGTTIEFIEPSDVGALPLFNQDMEAAFPPAAAALKDRIKAADGIIIATRTWVNISSRYIPSAPHVHTQ